MALSLIAVLLVFIIGFVIFSLLEDGGLKPLKASFAFIILIVTNWGLFLFGFYTLFPPELADLLWRISWISLSLMGVITGLREMKNNKLFAILIFCVSIFTVIFYLFSIFIGSM